MHSFLNLYRITNIYFKFNDFWPKRFGATQISACGPFPGPGYCYSSLLHAVTSQAGRVGYPMRMGLTQTTCNVNAQRDNFALGTQHNLYSTCSRWGFVFGVTQILAFALGVMQILEVLDTIMLVSPRKISCWGIAQRDGPTRVFSRRSGI